MLKRLEEYNRVKAFFGLNQKLLIAVSGGVDSMVLASIMVELGYKVGLAHCNYQLRGKDSDRDQKLVETFATEVGVPMHTVQIDTKRLVQESSSSIQMVAREERYKFFDSLMEQHGYDLTLLAHNVDDRVESLLMNVLRGTGFRGFQGMPVKRGKYVRPLSFARKDEIRKYAKEKSIKFSEDSSNSETYYQRNWVRLVLLPMLKCYNPQVENKLISFIQRAEETLPDFEKVVSKETKMVSLDSANEFSIKYLKESPFPFTLLKEVLAPFGFSTGQIFEVIDLLKSDSGAFVESESARVVRNRNSIIIQEKGVKLKQPTLKIEEIELSDLVSFRVGANQTLVDAAFIEREKLKIRRWKRGDKFRPLGMSGWKKLSDFFIDQKLSILKKEQTWLLTQNGTIVWVVGMRLDDRFKVSSNTQKVLKVTACY